MAAESLSPTDSLRDFLDEGRAEDGATARSALFWRAHIEAESSTLIGFLVSCVETKEKVRVLLRNGTVRHGRVLSVGLDVVCLSTDRGGGNLVAVHFLESVRSQSKRLTTSNRAADPTTMHEQIRRIAEQRVSVRIVMASGSEEHGLIVACGSDVCVVQNAQRELTYLSTTAIGEISVTP